MTSTDLTIHSLYNGENVDFAVRITRLGKTERNITSFSIEPLNCKIAENGSAQYILEPYLTSES